MSNLIFGFDNWDDKDSMYCTALIKSCSSFGPAKVPGFSFGGPIDLGSKSYTVLLVILTLGGLGNTSFLSSLPIHSCIGCTALILLTLGLILFSLSCIIWSLIYLFFNIDFGFASFIINDSPNNSNLKLLADTIES